MTVLVPLQTDLSLYCGSTFFQRIEWLTSASLPIDYSGVVTAARFKIREAYSSTTALVAADSSMAASTGTYVDITGAASGRVDLWVNQTATDAILTGTPPARPTVLQSCVYDVELVIPSGTLLTGAVGTALNLSGVTTAVDIVFQIARGSILIYPQATY
jgi:hypothetical protein